MDFRTEYPAVRFAYENSSILTSKVTYRKRYSSLLESNVACCSSVIELFASPRASMATPYAQPVSREWKTYRRPSDWCMNESRFHTKLYRGGRTRNPHRCYQDQVIICLQAPNSNELDSRIDSKSRHAKGKAKKGERFDLVGNNLIRHRSRARAISGRPVM